MNYANVFGRTQKQFDMTMNREKITVTDFFNSDIKYDVFFRRNQRSTTPQGKVRFFYAQSTPIHIGTIFVLNGENYIVTSQDGIESDIYFTSIAVRSDMTYKVKTDKGTASIPFVVVSDKWTVAHGTITQLNGAVALYTGYNSAVENIKVNDSFKGFGNYYKVGNTFKNNNLFYLYLEQTQAPIDNYKMKYIGVTSFDLKESNTYQLTYSVTNNGDVVENPHISYESYNLSRKMAGRQLLMCVYRKPEIKEQFDDFMNNDLNDIPVWDILNVRIDEEYKYSCHVDDEHSIQSYYRAIEIDMIEDTINQDCDKDGLATAVTNVIRRVSRRELLNKKWKDKYGNVHTTYDSWEDATDIVAIEKLLFTHFDEDFDDGTSLDLAVLDNELKDFLLDDVSRNGNTDGLTEEENRLFDRVSIA